MITFRDFIANMAYTKNLDNYLKVDIYQPTVADGEKEFINIPVNLESVLKYGNYKVSDIGIDSWNKDEITKISILISHPDTKLSVV